MRPRSDGERLRTSAALRALFHSRAFSRGREFHLEKNKKKENRPSEFEPRPRSCGLNSSPQCLLFRFNENVFRAMIRERFNCFASQVGVSRHFILFQSGVMK